MRPRAQRVHERGGVGRGAAPGVDVERALAHGRELAGADGAARGLGERQQVDDDVGLGQQRRQLVGAVDPVARAPGDADHLAVEGAEHRRERPADRAEAEDEHAQVRRVAELDELPVPARLLLGALAGAAWRRPGSRPSPTRPSRGRARRARCTASRRRARGRRSSRRRRTAPARRAAPGIPSQRAAGPPSAARRTRRRARARRRPRRRAAAAPSAVAVVGPGLHAAGSTRGSAARRRSRRSATSASSRLSSSARSAAAMASVMRSVRASACA